jgi:monoterpene epsilon-lactone hydrolase
MERSANPSWQTEILNRYLRRVKKKTNRFDIAQSRDYLAKVDRFFRVPRRFELIDQNAEGVDGQWIVAPESRPDLVVLYLHGGGFCLSETLLHKRMVGKLCRLSGFKAYMPFYRLAPESPYPAGLDDCVTSYRWLLSSGYEPRKIVIAGDSAGGGLTLATIGRLRDEGSPLPAAGVMLSAGTDLSEQGVPNAEEIERDPLVPWDGVDRMRIAYLGGADPGDPLVSPAFLDYTGFPPLLFHVGSTELLLGQALRAAEGAQRADVDVRIKVWENAPHVFQAMGFLPEARTALEEIARFMGGRDSLRGGRDRRASPS